MTRWAGGLDRREWSRAVVRQQGEFRRTSPTISEEARTPNDGQWGSYEHLLALGYESENLFPPLRASGGALDFFSTRDIKWWRSTATGDPDKKSFRLFGSESKPTRNLTSSQVLCVNFLLPLAQHPAVLLDLLQSLDDDVLDVVPIRYPGPGGIGLESLVDFEFVGVGGSLEGRAGTRGAHVTSCDALLLGRTKRGRVRAYLMEWKYQEQYVGAKSKATGDADDRRIKLYADRFKADDGPFASRLPLADLLYDPIYQIIRLGLLGDKLCCEGCLGVTEVRVVVVCPMGNTPYRDTVTPPALKAILPAGAGLEAAAEALWREKAGFRMTSPEALVAVAREQLPSALTAWSEYIRERYGW